MIGKFSTSGSRNDDLALIGGNCAIHGIDYDGEDVYWMVSGDNITAMDLIDIDNDDQNEVTAIDSHLLIRFDNVMFRLKKISSLSGLKIQRYKSSREMRS